MYSKENAFSLDDRVQLNEVGRIVARHQTEDRYLVQFRHASMWVNAGDLASVMDVPTFSIGPGKVLLQAEPEVVVTFDGIELDDRVRVSFEGEVRSLSSGARISVTVPGGPAQRSDTYLVPASYVTVVGRKLVAPVPFAVGEVLVSSQGEPPAGSVIAVFTGNTHPARAQIVYQRTGRHSSWYRAGYPGALEWPFFDSDVSDGKVKLLVLGAE